MCVLYTCANTIKIANDLGYDVVGYSVIGDGGATFSRQKVKASLVNAKPGSIIICHINHPEKQTGAGVIDAIPEMLKHGIRFVKLSDRPLK